MKIELLYFDGCPGYEELRPKVLELLAERGIAEDRVELRRVQTHRQAQSERFLGSPTLRVDGIDVDPAAVGRTDFGLECRLYRSAGVASRTPPEEWIRTALDRAEG